MASVQQKLLCMSGEFSLFDSEKLCVYNQFVCQLALLYEPGHCAELITVDLRRDDVNKQTLRLIVEPNDSEFLFTTAWVADDELIEWQKKDLRRVCCDNYGKIATIIKNMCIRRDSFLKPGMRLCRYDMVAFYLLSEALKPHQVIKHLGRLV